MKEIWKPIEGFDGYLVSNFGRVLSLPKNRYPTHRILKNNVDHYGYNTVCLVKNKKSYSRKLHRLVAEAFIPNYGNKATIDHIDGCKTNNLVTNLRWASIKENIHNPVTYEKAQAANKQLIKYAIEGNYKYIRCEETGEITKGITNLAKKLHCDRETIRFKIRDKKPFKGRHYIIIKRGR